MKSIIPFAALAGLLLVAGCNKSAAPVTPGASDDVRFSVGINHFAVRASDTAFDDGDEIGIFAGTPIGKDNVKATVSGSSVSVDESNPIKWLADQTDPTTFVSYYPYASTVDDASAYPFAVQTDQVPSGALSASDLMVANTTADPPASESDQAVVHLVFKHVLSKVVIKIDNQLDKSITSVEFTNVADNAQFNLGDEGSEVLGSVGEPAPSITAAPGTADGDKAVYQLIIVPQSARPQIKVTDEDGTVYLYSLSADFTFETGKRYTAEIAMTPETVAAEVIFTLEVTDWVDAEENPAFGSQEVVAANKWSVIGKLMGANWDKDFVMNDNQDDTWSITITYAEGDAFKFRFNNDWTYQYGMWNNTDPSAEVKTIEADWIAATTADNPTYTLADGSSEQPNCNIALPEAGEYSLRLCTYGDHAGQLFVTKN